MSRTLHNLLPNSGGQRIQPIHCFDRIEIPEAVDRRHNTHNGESAGEKGPGPLQRDAEILRSADAYYGNDWDEEPGAGRERRRVVAIDCENVRPRCRRQVEL